MRKLLLIIVLILFCLFSAIHAEVALQPLRPIQPSDPASADIRWNFDTLERDLRKVKNNQTYDINGGTIDGASIGASSASTGKFTSVTTDTIAESTGGTGVTVDGVLLKDSGIKFDASDTVLSKFKQGTWTPTLSFESGQTGSFTYGDQSGSYLRIGQLVVASCNVSWSGKPSGGIILIISGLPYKNHSDATISSQFTGSVFTKGVTFFSASSSTGSYLTIARYVNNENNCTIYVNGSGLTDVDPRLYSHAQLATAGQIKFTYIYLTEES